MRVLCCARSARDFPLQFPTEWIALPFANNPQRQLAKMQLKNFTLSTLCPRSLWVPLSMCVCMYVCVSMCVCVGLSRSAWHKFDSSWARDDFTLGTWSRQTFFDLIKCVPSWQFAALAIRTRESEGEGVGWKVRIGQLDWQRQSYRSPFGQTQLSHSQKAGGSNSGHQVLPWRVCNIYFLPAALSAPFPLFSTAWCSYLLAGKVL